MVCLCGRTIYDSLKDIRSGNPHLLSYARWKQYSLSKLHDKILAYPTFSRLISSLEKNDAIGAMRLLRARFLGYLGDVTISSPKEVPSAEFLTTEGVLLKAIGTQTYHMASALIDSIIRNRLLPRVFPPNPLSTVPLKGQRINVLQLLIEAVKFFDDELMRTSPSRSYKSSTVIVNGDTGIRVPRESVYDTELMRILVNWLVFRHGYQVTGQWHLRTDQNRDKYSDIVIVGDDYTIVLELLATRDKNFVKDHIQKSPEYKELLLANEAWVVHFTCEDDYQPIWPADEMKKGLNMIHFCHDLEFKAVSFSARWVDADGNISSLSGPVLLNAANM